MGMAVNKSELSVLCPSVDGMRSPIEPLSADNRVRRWRMGTAKWEEPVIEKALLCAASVKQCVAL